MREHIWPVWAVVLGLLLTVAVLLSVVLTDVNLVGYAVVFVGPSLTAVGCYAIEREKDVALSRKVAAFRSRLDAAGL